MDWTLTFFEHVSDWIIGTRFSIFLQNLRGMVPFTQTLHIFAISILLSSAAVVNLRVLGVLRRGRSLDATISRFMPAIWISLGFLAITGGLLLSVEPGRSLLTGQFQLKMLFLVIAASMTLVIQHKVKVNGASWDGSARVPLGVRALAVVSMMLWMAIIFAGRWIAYA